MMKIKRMLMFFAILFFLISLSYFYSELAGRDNYKLERINITKIVDGDTLETEIGKVRLLCINAPEKNHAFYEEAKSFLKELEEKEVEILRDKVNKDRYGRLLRYVFYNGRFVNKELLEEGLAHIYLCDDMVYKEELEEAEKRARENGKGIWKKSYGKCKDCIKLLSLNPKEEYFILKNNCEFECKDLELKDEANHFFTIDLGAGEEKIFFSKGKVWNDNSDSLFLRDEFGLILYYHY